MEITLGKKNLMDVIKFGLKNRALSKFCSILTLISFETTHKKKENISEIYIMWLNHSRKFKQDKFVPMSYGTIGLLSSTLYEEVKNKDFPLEFNPDVCCQLI